MRKKYTFISGFIPIVVITVAAFFIFISWREKTPVLKDVTSVYLEFVEADSLWGGGNGAEYTRVKIINSVDKNYLIDLFNNEYELYDVKCGCPCDNIKIVFETDDTVYTFGVGVIGDGNSIYYNLGKYMGIPYEQYMELMAFFSKFDETSDYSGSWISEFK